MDSTTNITTPSPEPEYIKERWVYAGHYRTVAGKLNQKFHSIAPDGSLADNWLGYDKLVKHAQPGSIFEVHVKRDDKGGCSVTTGGERKPVLAGTWPVKEDRRAWAAADDALVLTAQYEKSVRAKLNEDDIAAICEPVRRAYMELPATQRAVLLGIVIKRITMGGK
jgi:hypothetical protein